MTQVAFVAAGASASATNGSLPALAYPAGVVDGDLIIFIGAIAAPARTYIAPSGWTTCIAAQNSVGTNGPSIFISTHVYVSGDATPVFTAGGTSLPGAGGTGRLFAYRNAATPIVSGTTYTSGATTGTTVGPITGVAVGGQGLAVAIGAWANSWTSAPSVPSGWTVESTYETTAASVNIALGVFEKAYNATTSASVSIVGSTTAATRAGIQISIPEATSLNKVKVGATQVSAMKVGSLNVDKMYVGSTQVWP